MLFPMSSVIIGPGLHTTIISNCYPSSIITLINHFFWTPAQSLLAIFSNLLMLLGFEGSEDTNSLFANSDIFADVDHAFVRSLTFNPNFIEGWPCWQN